MATRLYDEALVKKIQNWTGDQNIKITGPDETRRLFQYRADTNGDKPIELPLITITKGRSIDIQNLGKRPLSFDGWKAENSGEKGGILNGIPITISYQIDIYCRYYAEADEYVRNFVFNIINYPKLTIEIPYNNTKRTSVANIRLNGTIDDNSDIPERLIAGEFTRFTIPIYIDDGYLLDYRIKDNWRVQVDDVETTLKNEFQDVDKEIN